MKYERETIGKHKKKWPDSVSKTLQNLDLDL